MTGSSPAAGGPGRKVRFADFELDLDTGELSSGGRVIALQAQPALALRLLVSRSGRLVRREEMVRELWPETVVEYDQGLDNVIRIVRKVLGDSASRPRFVETVPRQGHRFVAAVAPVENGEVSAGRLLPEAGTEGDVIAGARPRNVLAIGTATVALVLALWALRVAWPSPAERGLGQPEAPTLAVLPFDGGTADEAVLGASLAEELTRELAVVPGGALRVIGHDSAVRAGRAEGAGPRAGALVGASHVVVGRVSGRGSQLELAIEVLQVRDGARVWTERFLTSRQQLLVTKSAVAAGIARSLGAAVGGIRAEEAPEMGAEALEGYLRARYLVSDSRWGEAIPLLRGVLEVQPGLAAARAGLAEALLASSQEPASVAEARELTEALLRADPDDADGHVLRARIALSADWNWAMAEAHLARALELAAGDPSVHLARAAFLSSLGRHREAREAAEVALALDPLSTTVRGDLAMFRFWAGDWPGVLTEAERLLELEPGAPVARSLQLEALLRAGRWDRAREVAGAILDEDPRLPAAADADLRATVLALQEERWQRREDATGAARAIVLASLAAQQGRADETLELLEEAVRLRTSYLPWLPADPHFASVRTDPRFRSLLARAGHPWARGRETSLARGGTVRPDAEG